MSNWIQDLLDKMSPEDQKTMREILRDENTFLAENMDDVVNILEQLRQKKLDS